MAVAIAQELLGRLIRLALAATVLAVLLGRAHPTSTSRPEPPRRSPTAARIVVDREPVGEGALFFDPATGRPSSSGPSDLHRPIASPWSDEAGRWQAVGVSSGRASGIVEEPTLLRVSMPDGAVLDRLGVDSLPVGRPCWFPDRSSRVLFVDARGRLSRVDFDAAGEGEGTRRASLSWREGVPGGDGILAGDLSWPADPRLGGRVLATLCPRSARRDGVRYGPEEVWWLQLDRGASEVIAAGRLTSPTSDGPEAVAERCPAIGTGPDGGLILAYMERRRDDPWLRWRLRVAPVRLEPETGVPVASGDRTRTLAEGCLATEPAFSADGRTLGCIPWPEAPGRWQVRRVDLPLAKVGGG